MSKLTTAIATLGIVAGLGVAALPLSSYADTSATTNTAIKATVEGNISITANKTEADLGTVVPGGAIASDAVTYTIETNNGSGYTVNMVGSGTGTPVTDLVSGANKIATGVPTENIADGGTSAWGFQISNYSTNVTPISTYNAKYAAVPATSTMIAQSNTKSEADGDTFELTYGVAAAPNQDAGVYTGQVTLTATVK